jgi:hypothetical protein
VIIRKNSSKSLLQSPVSPVLSSSNFQPLSPVMPNILSGFVQHNRLKSQPPKISQPNILQLKQEASGASQEVQFNIKVSADKQKQKSNVHGSSDNNDTQVTADNT